MPGYIFEVKEKFVYFELDGSCSLLMLVLGLEMALICWGSSLVLNSDSITNDGAIFLHNWISWTRNAKIPVIRCTGLLQYLIFMFLQTLITLSISSVPNFLLDLKKKKNNKYQFWEPNFSSWSSHTNVTCATCLWSSYRATQHAMQMSHTILFYDLILIKREQSTAKFQIGVEGNSPSSSYREFV